MAELAKPAGTSPNTFTLEGIAEKAAIGTKESITFDFAGLASSIAIFSGTSARNA